MLGSLIIKERLGIDDRETVQQIKKNPYLQYFIGLTSYQQEAPLEASMMVHFRKRIDKNLLDQVNKKMVKNLREKTEEEGGGQKKKKRK